MKRRLRVMVLGEGKDERGPPRSIQPFAFVPRERQGAMEILVRRKLFALLHPTEETWHSQLDDGLDVVQPGPTREAMVEVLANAGLLALIVTGALRPVTGGPRADLVIATHDAEDADATIKAVSVVNATCGLRVPLLLPGPEIQAWLTSKRAVERTYDHEHCTVPEVDEAALKDDAKSELKRLLAKHGDAFSAANQARLAEVISIDDIRRFAAWNGWDEADRLLETTLLESGLLDRESGEIPP